MTKVHYPEFNLYRPSRLNGFSWSWEIIDPPSQGVYCDGREYSMKDALSKVRMYLSIIAAEIGVDDPFETSEPKRIRNIYRID